MNILAINKSDRVGGAAELSWDLKTELEKRGHQVSLFVCDKTSSDKNVLVIPRPKWRFYLSHLLGTDIGLFQTDYILKTNEFKQADIIHCHNLHGHYFNLKTLIKMSRLKPVVWTLHDLWAITPYCSQAPNRQLNKGFYGCSIASSKSIMKYFNQICLREKKRRLYHDLKINLVAPSMWLKQKLQGSVLSSCPTTLIHHGIKFDNFFPQDKSQLRQKLGLPLAKKIVLFVASGGRNNLWKGWSYASAAMDYFKDKDDVLFVCLGGQGGADTANLKFIDYIDDKNLLAEYFKAADAFLLSSTAESFALVALEAMAAGLPIVSFEVGVIGEVIKHKDNGYIAEYLNGQDLAKGLEYVLSFNQDQLDQIAKTNQTILKQAFSQKTMVEGYLALYNRLLAKK